MNIRDFKYLVELEKQRHFTKAAKACFVTQSTLSGQIKKLENHLGFKIFIKNGSNLDITIKGKEIIAIAKTILKNTKEIEDIISINKDRKISIGSFPSISSYIFRKIINHDEDLLTKNNLEFVEEKSDLLIENLKKGIIDNCFLANPLDDHKSIKLFEEEFYLGISKKSKLAKYKKINIEKIKNEKVFLLEGGNCFGDSCHEICKKYDLKEELFRSTNFKIIKEIVKKNKGVSFFPKSYIAKEEGIIYLPLFLNEDFKREIYFVYKNENAKIDNLKLIIKKLFYNV